MSCKSCCGGNFCAISLCAAFMCLSESQPLERRVALSLLLKSELACVEMVDVALIFTGSLFIAVDADWDSIGVADLDLLMSSFSHLSGGLRFPRGA